MQHFLGVLRGEARAGNRSGQRGQISDRAVGMLHHKTIDTTAQHYIRLTREATAGLYKRLKLSASKLGSTHFGPDSIARFWRRPSLRSGLVRRINEPALKAKPVKAFSRFFYRPFSYFQFAISVKRTVRLFPTF